MIRNEAAERLRDGIGSQWAIRLLSDALAEERRHVIEQIRPLVDYAMGPAGASMAASDAVRAIRTRLDDLSTPEQKR